MKEKEITGYLKRITEKKEFVDPQVLEIIPYKNTGNTTVTVHVPEFTSLCPKTGLPDFGEIIITYIPDKKIIELKSLKYYFLQFRNTGIYYENLTQLLLDHFVPLLRPVEMFIEARFSSRGGLHSNIISTYRK